MAASSVEICMYNHFYTIGGVIRKQKEGGSIGSDLTGEEARLYMIQWDDKLLSRCKELGLHIDLYKRYVDDMVVLMRAIGKGWTFDRKKNILTYSLTQAKKDCNLTPTQKTTSVLMEIANKINNNIQVTSDSPEDNVDSRMPVLDLKVWIQHINGIPQIVHTFFQEANCFSLYHIEEVSYTRRYKESYSFSRSIKAFVPHIILFTMVRIS